jgi:hypothetical protein
MFFFWLNTCIEIIYPEWMQPVDLMFLHVKLETFFLICGLWRHVDSNWKHLHLTSLLNQKSFFLGKTATDQSCYQHKVQAEKQKVQFVARPCRLYYKVKPSCSFIFFSGKLINVPMHGQALYLDATVVWCQKIHINIVSQPADELVAQWWSIQ